VFATQERKKVTEFREGPGPQPQGYMKVSLHTSFKFLTVLRETICFSDNFVSNTLSQEQVVDICLDARIVPSLLGIRFTENEKVWLTVEEFYVMVINLMLE